MRCPLGMHNNCWSSASPLTSWLIKPSIPLFNLFSCCCCFFFFFFFPKLYSRLFPLCFALFFCSSPLKISASIFSFTERQIKVVSSSSCLSVWSTWRNHYSLILEVIRPREPFTPSSTLGGTNQPLRTTHFVWFYSLWDLSNSIYLLFSIANFLGFVLLNQNLSI